jgi:2-phosphosulfolactate phosphatase
VPGNPSPLSGALSQQGFDVRFDWGELGAGALVAGSDVLVVVDVLSFTTTVDVAVGRGALVYPTPLDEPAAGGLARELHAQLAVHRSRTSASSPYSLSPSSVAGIPPGTRLVLPSPNGAAVSAAVGGRAPVIAGCLRNAAAVSSRLRSLGRRITVLGAGERWADGSLRPALEDMIGAGAILSGLGRAGLSPEAEAAVAVYDRLGASGVAGCASASELALAGYAADVRWAAEQDVSTAVPVLHEGAFQVLAG